jgi:hypothetical protein
MSRKIILSPLSDAPARLEIQTWPVSFRIKTCRGAGNIVLGNQACCRNSVVAYVCQYCGETHEDLPLDIAFDKPGAYLALPARQRKSACKMSADWCIINRERFFIRGCVFVPVLDIADHFVWGVWAEVPAHVFERYQALYEKDGTAERPYRALLSVEREPRYAGMDGLLVSVQFSTAEERPSFTLLPSNHWLHQDQHNGINLHRVQQILHRLFPEQF